MWKKILAGVVGVLVLLVGGFLVSPWGPLVGGALEGEVHNEPVSDWSFVSAERFCKFEVSRPEPRSFTVTCLTIDKDLYLGCMRCPEKSWSPDLDQYPEARYKAADKLYAVNATRIRDEEERQRLWDARLAVDGAESSRVPDDYWVYRLVSR